MLNDISHLLTNLDLSENEAKIYLLLIQAPGIYPTSTIAKKLKLNRITTYKALLKLCKMNLLTKTMKHGITSFMAEDVTERIEKLLDQKKAKLNAISNSFLELLPKLESLRKDQLTVPKMKYYEGIEGMKRVYEDTLFEENATIYVFKNVDYAQREIYDYLLNEYIPKRSSRNISAFAILPFNEIHQKWESESKEVKRQIKFLPKEDFPLEIEIVIYGKKVAFFSYENEEGSGIILEDQSIKNSMKCIFDVCWKIAK